MAVVLAVPSASASTRNASANTASKGPLVEAIITSFTGPTAFIGTAQTAAASSAIYEINKAGGVLGHKFTFKTVNTRGDPADALPLVERFLSTTGNIVGALGTDGATVNELAPLISQHKIVLTSSAGTPNFDRTRLKYFWRFIAPDPVGGLAMSLYAKKEHLTRIALVFGTDTSAQGDLPGIDYGVKHLHLDVVANEELTPNQPSYQSQAAAVLAAKPQAVFTEETASTAGTFFGELKALGGGPLPKIVGDSATIVQTWLSAVSAAIGKSTLEKHYVAEETAATKRTAAAAQWATALSHAPDVPKPVSQWTANVSEGANYDGVILVALAILAAHSLKPTVYNGFMKAITEPGKGKVVVHTFAQGKNELAKGKKIQYVGVEGPIHFNKWHNSYGEQVIESFPTATTASAHVLYSIPGTKLENAG
jgi:ABC-type branched-subunit amino acid transport system substrate-binding protein